MIDLEFVGDYRNPQQLTARQRELGFDGQSDGDLSFGDFLDIINPLQHLPIVSTLYREITGDAISPHARILGGALFGGPVGFLSAAANALYEETAGEDIGQTLVAFFTGEEAAPEPQFAGTGDQPAELAAGEVTASLSAAPLTTGAGPAAGAVLPQPEPPAPVSRQLPPGSDATRTAAAGPGMLTGQDAMQALFNDLRGGSAPPPAVGTPDAIAPRRRQDGEAAMRSYPLPDRPPRPAIPAAAPRAAGEAVPGPATSAAAAAVHPLIVAQNAGEADIAERMMLALEKYATLSRQRHEETGKDRADGGTRPDPAEGRPGPS